MLESAGNLGVVLERGSAMALNFRPLAQDAFLYEFFDVVMHVWPNETLFYKLCCCLDS